MEKNLIDRKLVTKVVEVTLDNAQDLIDKAHILFSKNRFARTYTLGQICLEELAKAKLFHDALECKNSDCYLERLEVAFGICYSHLSKSSEASLI